MNILIIDAQGGGIGRQLVAAVKKALPGWYQQFGRLRNAEGRG